MSLKLALALRGHWAIAEEAAWHYHNALVSNTLAGEIKADESTPPILINPDEDDPDDISDPDAVSDPDDDSCDEMGQIAMICMRGPIMQYGGFCSYGATDYARMIREYADDPSVCAVLLDMNTPGGQVYGTNTWAEAVAYCKAIKPIIGFCEDGMVASAGVWGWSFCTERYVGNPMCQTGSVGVMATYLDFSKALQKNGINQLIIRAPQSKNKNKTVDDAFAGKPEAIEAELEFLAQQFIDTVTANLSPTGDDWHTGKMFFAAEAEEIGLIDGIMSRADVMQRITQLVSNNPQNKSQMFGNKVSKLTALVGVAAGSITADQVKAINEQFAEAKIDGVTLCLDSELDAVNASVEKITGLESTVNANAKIVSDLQAQITEKDKKIVALEAKIAGKPVVAADDAKGANDTPPAAAPDADKKVEESIETQTDRDLKAMQEAFQII